MENVRNHRDIKLVTTNKQRSKFASEPNYHSTKYISKHLLIMEMKKDKPIYLGQAMLDISKTLSMNFGMITLNLNTKRRQDYAIWIQIALLFTLKQKMWKDGLIHQIMMKRIKDLFQ